MKRVLVVDDDPTIRSLVAEALSDEGYIPDEAADGAEALAVLRERRPDVIVLDLMMPVMDGWQFATACRREPGCAGIPIVVMSAAYELSSTATGLQELGVRACVAKPFDLEALLGIVERVTRRVAAA